MPRQNSLDIEHFQFRGLHPAIFMGTASDRYLGWIGQIYSAARYAGRISSRTKKIGKQSFAEKTLPVESVAEYFEHFRVLEIDYTFYSPLLDDQGEPTRNFHVLKNYCDHLVAEDYIILKVPQIMFAQKILQGHSYVANELYLNPDVFLNQFYWPALQLAGSNLRGFIFEQEYQRKSDRTPVAQLAASLNTFFNAVPSDDRYHVELRTESYLTSEVFAVLEKHGVGQVLSHWTWLPPLERQWTMAGRQFLNSGKQCIIRLMTPLGTRYQDAYAKAYPFDRLVEGMLQARMIDDTVMLMREGCRRNIAMNVLINNRAGGNAPAIAQILAQRFPAVSEDTE